MKLTCVARHPGIEVPEEFSPMAVLKCGVCGLPLREEASLTPSMTKAEFESKCKPYFKAAASLASEMLRARRAEEKAKNRRPITEGKDGALAEIMMVTFGLIFVMEYDKALEQLMVGTPDEPAILAQAAESK